ncbi:MAG: GntR family transcriptional regulator [Thermoactinospora sp.]|nr:GntR family transcriptional regulator [Thermoactinospora sp.]
MAKRTSAPLQCTSVTAPYLRIVADLTRDIARLHPGDRIPSTRQIAKDYGVAMATATKVLTTLQNQGLVHALPGVGTVVSDPHHTPRPAAEKHQLLATALHIADTEGLAALTMRRLATELGLPTMSLYRHIRDKDTLLLHMTDAALGEIPLPDPPPPGWRAQLDTLARLQWATYRRHPWLAQVISFTRPMFARAGMAHTEWALRALNHLGLPPNDTFHAALALATYVRGVAVNLETEAAFTQDSGFDEEQWLAGQEPELHAILDDGDHPNLTALIADPALDYDLDSLFDHGLHRLLDGIAHLIDTAGGRRRD